MNARETILARIARARATRASPGDADDYVHRHPRGPILRLEGDLGRRFCDQARGLGSDVAQVATMSEVPAQVAHYLRERELPVQAVCWPALTALDWRAAGLKVEARAAGGDDPVGITGAFVVIAETGTLMLLSGPHTPATVSLLPETHIAVVEAARIVATMEDAWDRLRREHGALPRAVTFISGPSRTADIEQTITLGAHGPARVCIVVVDDGAASAAGSAAGE